MSSSSFRSGPLKSFVLAIKAPPVSLASWPSVSCVLARWLSIAIHRLRHIHRHPAAIRSRVGFGAGSRVRELVYRVCVQAGDGQTARIDGIEAYVRAVRHADDHPERLFHALR